VKEKDEVLATQKLLDTIRGEGHQGPSEFAVESTTPLTDHAAWPSAREKVILTRPLRSRSILPGRVKAGLDIGTRRVKLVRLERGAKGFRLLQLGLAELDPEGDSPEGQLKAQMDAARALLRDVNLHREPVVTCLCDPGIIIRQIMLPYMPLKDLERAIPFEARKHIPYDPTRVTIHHQIVSGGRKDRINQVLLVAVPHEALQRHRELLRALSLEPYAIEVGPLVLANAYLLTQRNPLETIVLLDLGSSGTLIDIRREEGIFFCRHLPISGDRFTKEIQSRMALSFEEAEGVKHGEISSDDPGYKDVQEALRPVMESLLMEIRRSLAYYDNVTGRMGFSRLLLTGGGALLPGLSGFLEEELELSVEVMDPLAGIDWDDAHYARGWIEKTRPMWTLGVGLAGRP
jgi:type IV pilus assembly protein PilM